MKFRNEVHDFLHSILFKIWLIFLGFTFVILLFTYVSQIVLMPRIYEYMKTQEIISTANEIKYAWTTANSASTLKTIEKSAKARQMDILIHIPAELTGGLPLTYSYDSTGSSVSIYYRVSDSIVSELRESQNGIIFFPGKEEEKQSVLMATYVGTSDAIVGYIFIYTYLEPTGTTTQILKTILLTSSSFLICLSFIVSFFISSRVSKPIINISRSAQKLINGEFNVQVQENEYTEIKRLTENLNTASEEIAKIETLQKDLMANVSHDLRTPLTMIKAYAEMIRDLSGNNPEKREKHLQVIIDEADRLTLLVSDILNLSKLQSGVIEMEMKPINFSEDLKEIVSRFSMLEQTEIALDVQDDIYINGDQKQLGQSVYNLIINAINYSREEDTVTVRLHSKNGKVRFEVSDTGVGIPKEQLPYIWERYYKVDRSENHKRAVKGTGLGLSIVKGVFERHHFHYGIESEVGKGSTFWFECSAVKMKKAERELKAIQNKEKDDIK
ncbi:MAG: HAMP domain-containing histidine kinase [Bacteroides sp.]|nr:HAMP domain-containing histidine kinase [Eubacterium sp.]MCM1417306.1 HAMP domain-containing histidine kinase [Roseburia sp.]MCM1461074.1 HAMP domain-containing histidine kinase [Bacteroides sp.]